MDGIRSQCHCNTVVCDCDDCVRRQWSVTPHSVSDIEYTDKRFLKLNRNDKNRYEENRF